MRGGRGAMRAYAGAVGYRAVGGDGSRSCARRDVSRRAHLRPGGSDTASAGGRPSSCTTTCTGGARSTKGEYRMSIRGFGRKRWAALVVAAVLGFAPLAQADPEQERRLRLLEQQLQRTQEELKQLRNEIEQQKAVTRANEEQAKHAAEKTEVAKTKTAKLPDWLNSFTPFGDVRFRTE